MPHSGQGWAFPSCLNRSPVHACADLPKLGTWREAALVNSSMLLLIARVILPCFLPNASCDSLLPGHLDGSLENLFCG